MVCYWNQKQYHKCSKEQREKKEMSIGGNSFHPTFLEYNCNNRKHTGNDQIRGC